MMEKTVSFKKDLESNSTNSGNSGSLSNLLTRLRRTGSSIRAVQVLVIFILVGALIGALYYAIKKGEVSSEEPLRWIPTDIYSPLFSQFAPHGKGTIVTVKKGEKGEEKEILNEFVTNWYQDDGRKEIVHKVDASTVAFVGPNATFYAQIDGEGGGGEAKECIVRKEHGGYVDYLIAQGLIDMDDRHPVRTLDGQSVFVFDANPGLPEEHWPWSHFVWGNALLTQAFVDKTHGTLKAWQTHYTLPLLETMQNGKEYVRRVEYWLSEMKRGVPEAFDGLPEYCKEK